MPLTEKIPLGDGLIGIFKIPETVAELEKQYLLLFGRMPSVTDFRHDRRKKEWLAIRILIAEMIGTSFSVLHKDTGAPLIIHSEYKYISISHSVKYAAVYLHKSEQVGLDVENMNRRFVPVEKKYLSGQESEQVKSHPVLRAVYWCCKEAVFKWAGQENVDFREQIRICDFDPDQTNTVHAAFFYNSERQTVKLIFQLFDGHVLVYTR